MLAAPAKSRINTVIPPSYFGMTINTIGLKRSWPDLEFGGVRLWGAIWWAKMNPAPGVYDWKRFDDILDIAARHHVDVTFNLAYTPRWAAAVKDAPPSWTPGASSPPVDLSIWEEWVRAVVTRAAGRIRYWEVWNEPEDPDFYSGDVPTMVAMQRGAYEVIKAIDPSLMVLTPSSNGTPQGYRWQKAFLAQGGGQFADIFAFHGYMNEPEAIIGTIGRFRRMLEQHDLADKPMWDSEAGWSAREENQAGCLVRSYVLKWIYGLDRFYWYELEGGGADYGKLSEPAGRLLAGGIAYRTAHRWLVGATVVSVSRKGASTWAVELRQASGVRSLLVWNAAGSSKYPVGPGYHRYQSIDEGEAPITGGAVEIGPKPLLLLSGAPG
ncbi:endo-1,4-beta-xylanase [Bradyrhizobium guangzhouense]|uniref:endo-1,4-beta-xylanase n=1 Tax=Bradyrhizobium guangzhouense TaxID=1325095 RepID=UPI001FDF47C8|nr:endo-1,4-beta-xylanase [Bradyrhizobium guangzhouense]